MCFAFNIGPLTLHGYGVMVALGLLATYLLTTWRFRKHGMDEELVTDMLLSVVICGALTAKITYCIVEWDSFIKNPMMFFSTSGFVAIGAIIGGFIGVVAYLKYKKVDVLKYINASLPGVCLGHALGRVGCFLAGCCYGMPYNGPFAVTFPANSLAIPNVPLFPVQLLSAVLLVGLCLYLGYRFDHVNQEDTIEHYLTLYCIGRFMVEFLRYDDRGVVFSLSTTQFVCLIILGILLVRRIILLTKKKDNQ